MKAMKSPRNFTVLIPISCWNSWRLHPTRRAFLTFESPHARLTRNTMRQVMQGSDIKAKNLKALPSVMAWIFLSSATMSSISCSSCKAPGQILTDSLMLPDPLHHPSFVAFPTPSLHLLLFQPEPATWPFMMFKTTYHGQLTLVTLGRNRIQQGG